MTILAKCACVTDNKNVFEVTKLVEQGINSLLKQFRDKTKRIDPDNQIKGSRISTLSQLVEITFTINGETRSLHLNFMCDVDAPELGNKKLLCSLGAYGQSDEIILACCKSLAPLGVVYHCLNDCSDRSYVQYDQMTVEVSA